MSDLKGQFIQKIFELMWQNPIFCLRYATHTSSPNLTPILSTIHHVFFLLWHLTYKHTLFSCFSCFLQVGKATWSVAPNKYTFLYFAIKREHTPTHTHTHPHSHAHARSRTLTHAHTRTHAQGNTLLLYQVYRKHSIISYNA